MTGHTDYTEANEQMSTSEYNTAAAMIGQDSNYIDQPAPEQPEFPHGAP